jgi:hypothetical protein
MGYDNKYLMTNWVDPGLLRSFFYPSWPDEYGPAHSTYNSRL